MKPYTHAVVIGRFQPFHNGHAAMLETALEVAEEVIVVLGSSFAARNCKNPFTADERRLMISWWAQETHGDETADRIEVIPMRDYYYSDALWVTDLQAKVRQFRPRDARVALVGHKKDASSYYLDLFPSWTFVEHDPIASRGVVLNATDIRAAYLSGYGPHVHSFADETWRGVVPVSTQDILLDIAYGAIRNPKAEEYQNLVAQFTYLKDYPKQWGKGPFITTDAVVTKAGHVLLIKRGQIPGKGLLAVPGGFLNPDERIVDGAIRELLEETTLGYTPDELKRRIVAKEVFDHPNRSERGRTVTHAFHFDLTDPAFPGLPTITGADDAAEAFWMPLYEVLEQPEVFFEDHQHIIRHFVSRA